MHKLLLLITFLSFNFAHAVEEEDKYLFRPDYWSKGLHLTAGGGVNTTYFDSNDRFGNLGYGLNGSTDLSYYMTNRFAVDWSSNVKFNRTENYLVWDTLITFGIRYRIKEYYVRAFGGRAPTVIFFEGSPPKEFKNSEATRLQYDGPVYGFSVGKMMQAKSGLIWYLESSATLQRLKDRQGIKMNGQVPEVVSREKDTSTLVSLYFMIGVLIF